MRKMILKYLIVEIEIWKLYQKTLLLVIKYLIVKMKTLHMGTYRHLLL